MGDGAEIIRTEGPITGKESQADLARRRIWHIPKAEELLPLMEDKPTQWVDRDKRHRTSDLVVVKGKNSAEMLTRARRELAIGTMKHRKLTIMYRHGRKNWARDVLME